MAKRIFASGGLWGAGFNVFGQGPHPLAGCLTTERSDILQFEKRCEARQNEIRAGSVLAYVTKRVAAITPPRALVVLRFLLNNPQNTLCIRPKLTTCSHPNSYTRSAEIGEIFGLAELASYVRRGLIRLGVAIGIAIDPLQPP